tara:strand:- start:5810 stop:5977 length:168 start_codon:yes stop_codon:yes gene_type:complete
MKKEKQKTFYVPMSSERFLWYKNEIQKLRKYDLEITLKIQHQLNVMDEKKVKNEK